MLTWSIELKELKLKYNWKISRNESTTKKNFFIRVSDGKFSGTGEVAPNIRYGEEPAGVYHQFNSVLPNLPSGKIPLKDLHCLIKDLYNSLQFGIESAYIHYLANIKGVSVSDFLGLPQPVPTYTSYTLPIMDPGSVDEFVKKHGINRFELIKLKVNAENAVDLTKALAKATSRNICIDANEAFNNPEEVLAFLEAIPKIPLVFLEQPFPASYGEEYEYLKKHSPVKLFADESVLSNPDFETIKKQFHGINMKLMKAGGYLKGIQIISKAKSYNLETMIGCMVETSLGIYSALHLAPLCNYADLDGSFILDEDPFNLVKEKTGAIFIS